MTNIEDIPDVETDPKPFDRDWVAIADQTGTTKEQLCTQRRMSSKSIQTFILERGVSSRPKNTNVKYIFFIFVIILKVKLNIVDSNSIWVGHVDPTKKIIN